MRRFFGLIIVVLLMLLFGCTEVTENNNESKDIFEEIEVVNGERERLMIIQDRCFKQCRQSAADFGLTVSSRCRLVVPKPAEEKKENKFAKFAR